VTRLQRCRRRSRRSWSWSTASYAAPPTSRTPTLPPVQARLLPQGRATYTPSPNVALSPARAVHPATGYGYG
jgi:hypothetical protein